MRRSYLCNCAAGDIVEDVYVLTGKQLGATTTNKFFIKAFVSDRTAQITARLWNATRELFQALPESGYVKLRGRIENYQNNLQCIIEQVWPARDGTYDVADLMPHTSRDIDQMCQRIFEMCGSVQNRHLAAILQAYLDDEELMNSFCKAPAAQSFHHAFLGGLLEHTLNSMEVADTVVRFYPGLNRDLVLTGIFLHDIAKTWELTYDCAFGYSDSGQLIGHIVKSAMWVERKARQAEEALGETIPQRLIDVLQHIILSHHGTLDTGFGSARNPSTPEAMMVHFIDDMDAKMMMALSATRGKGGADGAAAGPHGGNGESSWTEYMKAFNGRLYRPDVAPADAPIAEETAAASQPVKSNGQSKPQPVAVGGASITNPLFESNAPRKK